MELFVVLLIGAIIGFFVWNKRRKVTDEDSGWKYDGPRQFSPPISERERHQHRDIVVTEIKNWLDGAEITDVIVFDTETNGLHADTASVLSVSAIRLEWSNTGEVLTEKAIFNRFYYPKEAYNHEAVAVNGLSESRITELRGKETYPLYFDGDTAFKEFCQGAKLFVAHNIQFDSSFVPFVRTKRKLDTMKPNADVVCASWNMKYGEWKWPTLQETAAFYGIPFSSADAHGSLYDAKITAEILKVMLRRAGVKIDRNA